MSHALTDLTDLWNRIEARFDRDGEAVAARAEPDSALPVGALRERLSLDDAAVDLLVALATPAIEPSVTSRWRDHFDTRSPRVDELVAALAVSTTDERALRDAIGPSSPLVTTGVVTLLGGDYVMHGQREVRIDDRVVAYVAGSEALDRRLLEVATQHTELPRAFDVEAAAQIERALRSTGPIAVEGAARTGKVTAVVAAIVATGASAIVVDLAALLAGDDPAGRLALARRETVLANARLVLRVASWEDSWPVGLRRQLTVMLEHGAAVLVVRDGNTIPRTLGGLRRIKLGMPDVAAQVAQWRSIVGEVADVEQVCARYPLAPGDIMIAAAEVRAETTLSGRTPVLADLLVAARVQLRQRLGDVAELVSTGLTMEDVVLRDDIAARVRELVDAVRLRDQVMVSWGFEDKLPYGRSISALLSGPPGTGKTMVATVIGKQLGLEVFRVDLSKVVSKYIGETEKNLARVFDEASHCKAILLFDEADSLFSKRTEVRNSNDKHANLEVNFLLQRLETHDGVVILTTNAATSIDPAFLRRIRYRIDFPAPDTAERSKLWRSMIPATAPLAPDVDFDALGRVFKMTGGHIKNAVVRAAYRAVTTGKPAIDQATLFASGMAEWTELGNLTPPGEEEPAPEPRVEARGSALAITQLVVTPRPVKPTVGATVEGSVLRILTSSLRNGETIDSGYRRKEQEIVEVLGKLGLVEARALHRRLEVAAPDDLLAQQFSRLTRDRRERLISFLANARRREAIAMAAAH
jgi:AAA+ superfamily predicted ATPase